MLATVSFFSLMKVFHGWHVGYEGKKEFFFGKNNLSCPRNVESFVMGKSMAGHVVKD